MINKSLMIINHNTPCSCSCRYCFFGSCKTLNGIPYEAGEEIALRFKKWRSDNEIADFVISYAVSRTADYPELVRNIQLNKELNFPGYSYLQINGIRLRNKSSLYDYLRRVKDAGVTTVDTTFYGLREYHDGFAARKGDFDFLVDIIRCGMELGLVMKPTFTAFEDNKEQLAELVGLLSELGCEKIYGYIHDYKGGGVDLEDIRLTELSLDALPKSVKSRISIGRHKTEAEWIRDSNYSIPTSRSLVLALCNDNIDMIESMSCGAIIDYISELDDKYHNAIPDIFALSKRYGDINNLKLYRQRDLLLKWQKQYIRDEGLLLHDVTDENNCGAIRY